ncbi:segregation and condensation protein A [Bifidobacterium simiarum]|nr:ScpA family protein [Bifidobacterium simiarum]
MAEPSPEGGFGGFRVDLEEYSGPFDVLLGMLANRRLELTEVSLAGITGEFLDYIGGMDPARDMDEASAFVDVASVLVEAKSAALLPEDETGERDEQSMEALRERDLLFARLLQYRAFKRVAVELRGRIEANAGWHPHPAFVDEAVAARRPEPSWTVDAGELAALAARAIANAPAQKVSVGQLHVPLVDLREQAAVVRDRLRALDAGGSLTFDELTRDAASTIETVARFLAVLAFFRQGVVQFRQDEPYAELHVRWVRDGEGRPAEDDGVTAGDYE